MTVVRFEALKDKEYSDEFRNKLQGDCSGGERKIFKEALLNAQRMCDKGIKRGSECLTKEVVRAL